MLHSACACLYTLYAAPSSSSARLLCTLLVWALITTGTLVQITLWCHLLCSYSWSGTCLVLTLFFFFSVMAPWIILTINLLKFSTSPLDLGSRGVLSVLNPSLLAYLLHSFPLYGVHHHARLPLATHVWTRLKPVSQNWCFSLLSAPLGTCWKGR